MSDSEYHRRLHELVLNWKLRLVASALFSIMGLAFLISTATGVIIEDFSILDQTIVGIAVFVVVIPIYLILADLPKIDEFTIAQMLNEAVPELDNGVELVLKPEENLSQDEVEKRKQIKDLFEDRKLYKYLPNRPIKQAFLLMTFCLAVTAGIFYYFA